MTRLRLAVCTVLTLALGAGYFCSQWAFFTGESADYAALVDQPAIRWIAAVLFLVVIVLAMIPDRPEEPQA